MRVLPYVAVLFFFLASMAFSQVTRPYTAKEVHFEGTDYETVVYHVKGRVDGNTMLIVGGIQGDEPGGFLSADIYSKVKLDRGNLIVIPRANLKSVLLYDRGPEGDMNRLFTDVAKNTEMEKVVKVIIDNMAKANYFLNLHDGWGFHNEDYIDSQRNPMRFGQSIIVDEDNFTCSNNVKLNLRAMAYKVIAGANTRIPQEEYKLSYFSTRTGADDSRFKDMRHAATWYALNKFCIPAFAVESSKNISSDELKILYHNYAINEFLKLADIEIEHPQIYLNAPVLDYAIITVNGNAVTVRHGDTILVNKDDVVSVKHAEANYQTGVTVDLLGHGNLNDLGKSFHINYSTKAVFRKENAKFAEIDIKVSNQADVRLLRDLTAIIELNEERHIVKPNDTVKVKLGDKLKLLRAERDGKDTQYVINLKGWIPEDMLDNAGDDRGYLITIDNSKLMAKFSENGRGSIYPVTIERINGEEVARFNLQIEKAAAQVTPPLARAGTGVKPLPPVTPRATPPSPAVPATPTVPREVTPPQPVPATPAAPTTPAPAVPVEAAPTPPRPVPAPTPPTAPAPSTAKKWVMVNTPVLNIRAEPALTAQKIGGLLEGQRVEAQEIGDEWIRIRFSGKTGWISREFVEIE